MSVWETRKPVCPSSSDGGSVASTISDDEKIDEIHLNSINGIKQNGLNGYWISFIFQVIRAICWTLIRCIRNQCVFFEGILNENKILKSKQTICKHFSICEIWHAHCACVKLIVLRFSIEFLNLFLFIFEDRSIFKFGWKILDRLENLSVERQLLYR